LPISGKDAVGGELFVSPCGHGRSCARGGDTRRDPGTQSNIYQQSIPSLTRPRAAIQMGSLADAHGSRRSIHSLIARHDFPQRLKQRIGPRLLFANQHTRMSFNREAPTRHTSHSGPQVHSLHCPFLQLHLPQNHSGEGYLRDSIMPSVIRTEGSSVRKHHINPMAPQRVVPTAYVRLVFSPISVRPRP